MKIQVSPVERERILPFRHLYEQELNCQIVHHSAYDREGRFQPYLIEVDGEIAGYGTTWIGEYWMAKNSLFEFFVLPGQRVRLFTIFDEFIRAIKPLKIYTQTNDPFLGTLIYDYVPQVVVGHILFGDGETTKLVSDEVTFRRATPEDKDHIFKHHVEPVGDWLLEMDKRIIATGGTLYHYNRPYGDIFMEVDEPFRRQGFGSFLVQELKKITYQAGSKPAARCLPKNVASRRTLERAGFAPCGRLLSGETAYVQSG